MTSLPKPRHHSGPEHAETLDREVDPARTVLSHRPEGYTRSLARTASGYRGGGMSEQSSLLRQWVFLRTLSARHTGASVKELAEELAVCEKTVRRDLDTFQQAGFPVEETVGQHGLKRWRLDPAKTQPGLSFAFDEAVALYLGRRFLDPLAGTVFWDAAQRAFRKVRAMLSAQALKYLDRFAAVFHHTLVGASDYSKKADPFTL